VSALTELLERLVAIESVNPAVDASGSGEGPIAGFIAEWLERAGLEVEVSEVVPGRPNVIGTARGTGGGRTLLVNAHTDTVGVAAMEGAHEPRAGDGRMYGRGTYDMKAGLAAAMIAAASVRDLAGDVVVAAVCDEEAGGEGTRALVRSGRHFDAAIGPEPTDLGLAIAHKGFVGFEIVTAGRAAHGSMPELGIDAILKVGPVLVELETLNERLRTGPRHPLLGAASLHASLIEGGQEFSSYPARCLVTGERRWIPGETLAEVEAQLREAVGDAGAFRLGISREPFETAPGDPFVQLVAETSGESEPVGVSFWADSGLIAAAGIPTVLYGPIGEGAHAEVEWVDLDSVERVRDVALGVAVEWCR
jgi:acetylornithine deacetylase